HVLALIAEVFRDGETGQADARARPRRLVHLTVDQRAFRAGGRAVVLARVLVHPGLDELVIEIIALARALADPGEYRIAAVRLGDVVDELLDDHGLADAGATEQTDLAALGVGREQVNDFDPGNKDLRFRRLLGIERRRLVDRTALLIRHRAGLVDRIAHHVHDAAERTVADRHRDRLTGVGDRLAAHQAFAGIHGDRAYGRFAEMLGDLEHQALALVLRFQRVENRGQVSFELHVDDGADDLGDVSGGIGHGMSLLTRRLGTGDDLDQLLGDHRLAGTVVGQRLLAN